MKHKYNPWVSLVALLLLAIILVFTCTGCTSQAEATETKPKARFTCENVGAGCQIITDNETGNQYLYHGSGYGGGMCKMED